jgi:2-keto-4-pentenoate hydratase/2-oxohepta-3-ene-1,7-dioic acid hydratase in catechol pathway
VDESPLEMNQLVAFPDQLKRLNQAAEQPAIDLGQIELAAPISGMEKVICIGKNYVEHAREMGGQPPELPVVFNKFPSAISAPRTPIRLPKISQQVDFEAELVVVIGKPGRNIELDNAMDHVFGYCCGNDITARDWQKGKPGGQWLLGKTFDSFAPIGPAIVTQDEIADVADLNIQLRLNGEIMQDSNTRLMIFPVDFLISHLSQFVTLKPGDLIFTGTPPGVGAGRKPPVFLQPGDQLEVEIEGLGTLQNTVIADS